MREKLQRFMYGRYGSDRLNQFIMILSIVCLVLSVFGLSFFYVIALALLVLEYYRMFSKQISRRAAENAWYLKKETAVRMYLSRKKHLLKQLKQYHIYKCPGCKQKIRIPRGRGRVAIRCSKCGTEFIKKS
ncbi:MAG: zinc-ribbon domain-containing protein [Roseburia sp.]|nr:zinc-ribbon domain-containing protein [Roseburia sp.]